MSASQRDFGDLEAEDISPTPENIDMLPSERDFGFWNKIEKGIEQAQQKDLSQYQRETAGNVQGVKDVLASVQRLTGNPTLGGILPSGEENKETRNKFNEEFGNDAIATTGRFGGNVLASTPLMMGGEALAGLAGRGIVAGMPALAPAARFLGGAAESNAVLSPAGQIVKGATTGNKLTRLASTGTVNTERGALAQGLISSQSDDPLGEQLAFGAAVGTGAGLLGKGLIEGGRYAGNKIANYAQPFTEGGREKIANKILQGYAEEPLNINATQLIPGSLPTLAEATGNPGIAQLQDTLYQNNSKQFADRQMANSQARINELTKASGTKQDIEAAKNIRGAQAEAALGNPDKGIPSQLFAVSVPVETTPVETAIQNILSGKSGNRPAVVQSMKVARKLLTDIDGNPITDPETLYHSVRKGIDDIKSGKNPEAPAGKEAIVQLKKIQDALDGVIEKGAPGFKKYLGDYATASGPINAMQWLQDLNLKDAAGNITLSKVQNTLKNIDKLKGASGISKAKNLSKDQVSTLEAIRDDLLRRENLGAGKAFGSPTLQRSIAQNRLSNVLNNTHKEINSGHFPASVKGAAIGGMLGAPMGLPVIGSTVGSKVGNLFGGAQASRNALIRNRLQSIMLNPDSYIPPMASTPGMLSNILNSSALRYGGSPALFSGISALDGTNQQ